MENRCCGFKNDVVDYDHIDMGFNGVNTLLDPENRIVGYQCQECGNTEYSELQKFDLEKLRRRVRDALNKTNSEEAILKMASILNIKIN